MTSEGTVVTRDDVPDQLTSDDLTECVLHFQLTNGIVSMLCTCWFAEGEKV